jgi:hypothetical protein
MASSVPTVQYWQAITEPEGFKVEEASSEIRVYHQRKESLDRLEGVAREALGGDLSLPLRTAFINLGLSLTKERKTIQNAGAARAKLQRFVRPTFGASVATRVIDEHYWLEAMDRLHRPWGHLHATMEYGGYIQQLSGRAIFDRWVSDGADKTFWEWCTSMGLDTQSVPSVQYLAPDKRWRYWIVFRRTKENDSSTGLLFQHDNSKKLEPFDTRALTTHFSGIGFAIFVVSPTGTFYSTNHVVNKFHHSTFLAGAPVMAAGEWAVFNGRILFMSHKTGHYKAGPDNLQNALKVLDRQTDLSNTLVEVDRFHGGKQVGLRYVLAKDLLATDEPQTVASLDDKLFWAFLNREVALDPTLRPITDRLYGRYVEAWNKGFWGNDKNVAMEAPAQIDVDSIEPITRSRR